MASNSDGTAIFVPYARAPQVLAAAIVLPILSIGAVALRFYVRISRRNGIWSRQLVYPSCFVQEVLLELPHETIVAEKVEYTIALQLILAYSCIKTSIVFFYRRIFIVDRRGWFNVITWVYLGLNFAWTIAFFFLFLFLCGTHFRAAWGSRFDLITYCTNSLQKEEGLYISEYLMNILLLIMPIPALTWNRYGAFIFQSSKGCSHGCLPISILVCFFQDLSKICSKILTSDRALIASILRLGIVLKLASGSLATLHIDENLTLGTIYYWGIIEASLALIAYCLPTLKTLVSPQGLQSAVASVRSAISLQSLQNIRSNNSKGSKGSWNATKRPDVYTEIEGGASNVAFNGDPGTIEMKTSATFTHGESQSEDLEPGLSGLGRI
ncbi:plasma membrane Pth11 protein [Rutstroemia sp. NJR-2017a WRK4]|nr:plasma membrane Pth11 protein [Rutstroemia sp. NJR-2017a WRK4]